MSIFLWVLSIAAICLLAFLVFHSNEIGRILRMLKLAEIKINFTQFIGDYLNMRIIKRVPPELIYKEWKEIKQVENGFELVRLIKLYKIIDDKLSTELKNFKKNIIETELRMKRFVSHFILGCSLSTLTNKIIEAANEQKELKIKGKFKTDIEIAKEKFLNSLIEKFINRKEKGELPEIKKETKQKRVWAPHLLKIYYWFMPKKKPTDAEKLYDRFTNELKSELREGKINLLIGGSPADMRKYIFKDICEALKDSYQTGLNIKARHIEIYLEKNVSIKQILEYLSKLHHFDPFIDLDELEKFITMKDGENEKILLSLIDAKKEEIPVNLKDLWEYRLRHGNISTMFKEFIAAYLEGIKLTIPELTEQVSLKRNVEELIVGLIKLHHEGIEMSMDLLGEFQDKLKSIDQFVSNLIRASHLGLYFSYKALISFEANKGNILELMDVMIKAKQADIDITFDDCIQLIHAKGKLPELYEALKTAKRVNLAVSKENLMDLQRAGGDMSQLATAYDLSVRLGLEIKKEEIEADLIEGRNVLQIIFAIIYAKSAGVKVDYHTAIKFDRIPGNNVPARIRWSVDPQVFSIDPLPMVTKDAIEVKLKVNVTVRGKFLLYTQERKEEIFISRVKEVLVKEVERYYTYKLLVESLNHIAHRIYLRLTGNMKVEDFPELDEKTIVELSGIETKQNTISAFEVLDINIPSLEIDNDTLIAIKKEEAELDKLLGQTEADKRKHMAKALELEAKAKLIDSEAEVQLGIADAFKNGKLNTNDYLKKKIFDNDSKYNDKHDID
jgi:uncharacterized protein YqfA (UPF0365 family)